MFGAILLPDFALQAAMRHQLRRSCRDPIVVLGEEMTGRNPLISLCNTAALAAGVEVGMSSSQGLARCASLCLLTRSPEQETIVAEALLESAFSCSPWVEATTDGVCTFELRGNRPLDTSFLARVVLHLDCLGLQARVGVAATPDLALLAAYAGRPCLVVDDARAFLAALPVSILDPTPRTAAILRQWGIESLGALRALPPQAVTRRLGVEGRELWDRAAGRQQRLLHLARMPEHYEESMEFDYDVQTLEPLLFVLRRFLDQLVLRLEVIYRVPAALLLRLRFDDGQEYSRSFTIPTPTNNVETLFRVLYTHLEEFTAPSSICSLHLAAIPAVASREQFGLFETALRDPNRFSETLARLHALLGQERAGVARQVDTHRPDAFRVEAPDFVQLADGGKPGGTTTREPPAFGLPLCRLRPPLALQVEVEQRVPVSVRSTVINGKIRAARGPYQTLGGWWEPDAWTCEEWDVEVAQGGLHRLSKHPEGWFLEGTYG